MTTCIPKFRTALLAVSGGLVPLAPVAAQAYVGPGAGLTAIGTMIALIAALLLAVVGFVWYPIKRLMRSRKAPNDPAARTTGPRQ
ncbi:hypothetical protein [Tranquillimonas rosea]|uniref:hypothetical protein n=1 Tax=Tranquillimonas rosea TaxID=641238 RepID=UPI003BACF595